MAWLDIKELSELTETEYKKVLSNNFEDGYGATRALWIRSKKQFCMSWKYMNEADKATLQTYFNNNIGSFFTWTYPNSATEYTVRFTEDKLQFKYIPVGKWDITLTLEEI